ncbi:uncharacterized protein E1O_02060 [Burkholderiales bacterium GJ-E10]|nr:uncharacterized protein E1O_02060 [Burkholderiales bacterium GJ-E10]
MKVVDLNLSGNVGKTTIATFLLSPRLKCPVVSVESINAEGTEDEVLRGKQFADLMDRVTIADAIVIDVGASNIESFLEQMKAYRGSHDDFDAFVIPTVPKQKQIRDTMATASMLRNIGVPARKIRVVMNMVELGEDPEHLFKPLFEAAARGELRVHRDAVIHASEAYGKLRAANLSMEDVLSDPIDLKAALKEAKTEEDKIRVSRAIGLRRLVDGVAEELDMAFDALFS